MIILELHQVEIDYCPDCKGIWLDTGELELLIEDETEKKRLLNSFKKQEHTKEKLYRCPVCNKKMDKVLLDDEGDPVMIDKCKKSHGLWFDKNELYLLLDKSNAGKDNKVLNLLNDMFNYETGTKGEGA
ncbi:MAG: zf-TFIIB domain-containing protein [Bacteroidales bacterium]|nr:zf-TFIIB domain-containing protein [Bacteroidales bacterium]